MSSYDNNLYDAGLSSIARRLRIKDYQRPESIPLRRPVRPNDKEKQKFRSLYFFVVDKYNDEYT